MIDTVVCTAVVGSIAIGTMVAAGATNFLANAPYRRRGGFFLVAGHWLGRCRSARPGQRPMVVQQIFGSRTVTGASATMDVTVVIVVHLLAFLKEISFSSGLGQNRCRSRRRRGQCRQ